MPRLYCFVIAVGLLPSSFLGAQDTTSVTGIVKELNAKTGSITVRPSRKGALQDESYSLLKQDIQVTMTSGEKARLDVVAPGLTVQLKFGPAGEVVAIVVQPYVFAATVLDVDADKRTIKLALEENQPTTMAVTADAKVWLAGRPAYLREVKVGSVMTVTASLDGKTAMGLNLVSDPDGKHANTLFPRVKTSKLPGSRWVGVLSDVDIVKSQLHLSGPKTKGVPKSIPVAKDVVIQVIYGQVPLQELPLNQIVNMAHATVMISLENQQITRILVAPPAVRGKIKALDADGGRLIVDVDGSEKTFSLPKGVKVMHGTRVRRLADLQPNLGVRLILSLDREQLLAVDIRPIEP